MASVEAVQTIQAGRTILEPSFLGGRGGKCPSLADPGKLNKAGCFNTSPFQERGFAQYTSSWFPNRSKQSFWLPGSTPTSPLNIHTHPYKRTYSEAHQQQPTTATWCGFSTIAAGQLPGFPMRCAWSLLQQQLLHITPSSPPLPLPASLFCQ